MSIFLFLIILAAFILVHEFGHFIAAKQSGMRVDEFAIGFPPRIFLWKRGETRYAINLIPFGGYVKIFGEDPDEESLEGVESGRSFARASKWNQFIVLSAGVTLNLVFAWLMIAFSFMSGLPTSVSQSDSFTIEDARVVVLSVLPDSPAFNEGMSSGDTILGLSQGEVAVEDVTTQTVIDFIQASNGNPITLELLHEGDVRTVSITPKSGVTGDTYAIGISMDMVGVVKLSLFQALYKAGVVTWETSGMIAVALVQLVFDAVTGNASLDTVSGPVGIVGLVGDASNFGLSYVLGFAAFISINLAILNLMPFPALDGGRILFVIIEKIKGSPISPRITNTLNAIGFILLICLMIFVTVKDVIGLF